MELCFFELFYVLVFGKMAYTLKDVSKSTNSFKNAGVWWIIPIFLNSSIKDVRSLFFLKINIKNNIFSDDIQGKNTTATITRILVITFILMYNISKYNPFDFNDTSLDLKVIIDLLIPAEGRA
jgi:hypothetical protein